MGANLIQSKAKISIPNFFDQIATRVNFLRAYRRHCQPVSKCIRFHIFSAKPLSTFKNNVPMKHYIFVCLWVVVPVRGCICVFERVNFHLLLHRRVPMLASRAGRRREKVGSWHLCSWIRWRCGVWVVGIITKSARSRDGCWSMTWVSAWVWLTLIRSRSTWEGWCVEMGQIWLRVWFREFVIEKQNGYGRGWCGSEDYIL